MEKFNYQIVFKWDDSNRIIFTGQTKEGIVPLIETCIANLDLLPGYEIENVVYSPVNSKNYESEKES